MIRALALFLSSTDTDHVKIKTFNFVSCREQLPRVFRYFWRDGLWPHTRLQADWRFCGRFRRSLLLSRLRVLPTARILVRHGNCDPHRGICGVDHKKPNYSCSRRRLVSALSVVNIFFNVIEYSTFFLRSQDLLPCSREKPCRLFICDVLIRLVP